MKLFFRESGSGYPLIILHGLYGSSDNWHTYGRALEKQYHVFMLDMRNHGRSPHDDEFNYEVMRDDLLEFYETHTISRAILLGHSMGGKTAMYFASTNPEKVEKLIIVDIAPKSYKNQDSFTTQLSDHQKIVNALQSINLKQYKSRKEVDAELEKTIKPDRIRQFLLKNLKGTKDEKLSWALNIRAIADNLIQILNGFENEFIESGRTKIHIPALFIKGELSNYILERDYSLIQNIFPNSTIKTIPETGHWLHAEKPDEFLQIIKEFLNI